MLTLRNVCKRYGSLVAVDGLSLEIRRGEIFGLLGPNGAGKTTTVHIAVGLLDADEGDVSIEGLGSPDLPEVRAHLGIAPQSLSIYETLTAEQNLRFFGRIYGLSGRRLAERVAWALDFVALADRRRDAVRTYSGGMKRRLNIAVALVHHPDLILLDEPTAGVDPQSRNSIFDSILALKKEGRTIVYTTHYIEEAERLCDRVAIIDHGKVLALDTVPGLLAAHGGRPALVAETGGKTVRVETNEPRAELNRLAASNPIERFWLERSSLEQVFLNLTGRQLRD
jgi:ABC-2 type transport system ATP-binding protein